MKIQNESGKSLHLTMLLAAISDAVVREIVSPYLA